MYPIIVLAGVIRCNNKILIAKRYVKELDKYKWEFPGGKLEENETLKDCLRREIKEELNLDIVVGEIFEVVYHRYSDKTVLLIAYLCDSNSYKALAIECVEYKWISLNEFEKYDFLDADKPIVDKILKFKDTIWDNI
ncbi:(deoxy)nucleoside triphosphate pyrophosphohydrolase [Wukongibacter baidiensis]|uniref:(deoxy)nucleoside triphosphate pyrophosphohydrolase n=1 Tax=Wukongibacter baidiensis TaxID=1723361 RepID=UPI003D7FDB7C